MSELRADALRVLTDWVAPTPAQESIRQRYVDYLSAHPSGVLREDRPHHLTASTLVVSADGASVLLTLHAKARQWFQFGGHLEPGDASLLDAAAREVAEESGVPDLLLQRIPVQLSDHAVPFCGDGVHHYDIRFVAVAPADAVHAISKESLDVRWFPVDALPTADPDMLELVELARRQLA